MFSSQKQLLYIILYELSRILVVIVTHAYDNITIIIKYINHVTPCIESLRLTVQLHIIIPMHIYANLFSHITSTPQVDKTLVRAALDFKAIACDRHMDREAFLIL